MLTVAFLVGVAVLSFLAVEIGPLYAADRFRDLREPTDAERGRLEYLRETAGIDVDRIAIERRGENETEEKNGNEGVGRIEVAVRGPPRRRVLFLSEAVLDDVDDDVVIGLFAAEAGRVGTYYGEFRAVAIAAVVGCWRRSSPRRFRSTRGSRRSSPSGSRRSGSVDECSTWPTTAPRTRLARVASPMRSSESRRSAGSNRKPATGRRGSRCSRRSAIGSRRCGSEKGRRSRETPLSMKMWARYRVRSATAAVASTLTS